MKTLLLALLFTANCFAAEPAVDLTKPIPALRLPDGRVLQQAVFTTYRGDDIFIKHKSGSAIVRYDALPSEYRAEAEKKRPGGSRYYAGDRAEGATNYKGQVFAQTQGSGPYKFGNVKVYAFDVAQLPTLESNPKLHLPVPLAETTTDGDGKFSLNVPAGSAFFFFVQAKRLLSGGPGEWQYLEWRVSNDKIKEKENVILSNDTVRYGWSPVTFEPTP